MKFAVVVMQRESDSLFVKNYDSLDQLDEAFEKLREVLDRFPEMIEQVRFHIGAEIEVSNED